MNRILSFVAAASIVLGSQPDAWGQQEGVAYRIRSVDSGMVLSVEGNPAEEGAKIHQADWQQHPLQQWKMIEVQGSFQIVNRATGKMLDIADSSKEQGARIVQNVGGKAKSQQWTFEKRGKHFAIKNRLSGHVLNVQGASREAGGAIIQWPAVDADNELWELVAADANAKEVMQWKGNGKPFMSVKFALGGKRAVSADRDSKIVIWDLEANKEVQRIEAIAECMDVSKDGTRFVTGGPDRAIRLWEVESGKELKRFLSGSNIFSVALSPDGSHVLSASYGDAETLIRLWSVEVGTESRAMKGGDVGGRTVAFCPDGKHAVSSDAFGSLILWNVKTGKAVRKDFDNKAKGNERSSWIRSMAVSSDGDRLLTAGVHHKLTFWQLQRGKGFQVFPTLNHSPVVRFSSDETQAMAVGMDQTVVTVDLKTGATLQTVAIPDEAALRDAHFPPVDLDAGRRRVIVGCIDDRIRVYDLPPATAKGKRK